MLFLSFNFEFCFSSSACRQSLSSVLCRTAYGLESPQDRLDGTDAEGAGHPDKLTATWMRWAATALALTDGWVDLGSCWAAPSQRISAQLFRLVCVEFIFDISSSQRCRRAALSYSMRWSAMSGSPESSYCFSKSWYSSSKHGVYVWQKPRGIEWQAAFCIAPQNRWHNSSMLMLLTGISGVERSVAKV